MSCNRRLSFLVLALMSIGLLACKDDSGAAGQAMLMERFIAQMPAALEYEPFEASGALARFADGNEAPLPTQRQESPAPTHVDTAIENLYVLADRSSRKSTWYLAADPVLRVVRPPEKDANPATFALWMCPNKGVAGDQTEKRCDRLTPFPSDNDNLYLCEGGSRPSVRCPTLGTAEFLEATVYACPAKSREDKAIARVRGCFGIPFPIKEDTYEKFAYSPRDFPRDTVYRGFNNRKLISAYPTCLYEAYRAAAWVGEGANAEDKVISHQRQMLDICMIREGFMPKRLKETPPQ